MTTPPVENPTPAPPASPPTPPPAPPAPPAPDAAPAPPQPQQPEGDPRPRSQRIAASKQPPAQEPNAVVTPPTPTPPAPAPPAPPAPTPAPEQPAPRQKTEAEIIQEHNDRVAADAARAAAEEKLTNQKALFATAPVKIRDLLNNPETSDTDVIKLVEDLVEGGLDAAAAKVKDDLSGEVVAARGEVLTAYEAFKQGVVDSFYTAIPEALHDDFTDTVDGKGAAQFVAALVNLAHKLPEVRQALIADATPQLRELVPEGSRSDFDAELGKTKGDLSGLAHALYQSGFLAGSDAPVGSRPARESGPGGMDIERWKTDREFRKSLSRDENNRYLAESQRLENAKASLA